MTDIVIAKTTVEILVAGRAFIEKGWTQGEFARDLEGAFAQPFEENAVCWCAVGAIRAAANHAGLWATSYLARERLRAALPDGQHFIAAFNDASDTTKEGILALFDLAIANEKAKVANV